MDRSDKQGGSGTDGADENELWNTLAYLWAADVQIMQAWSPWMWDKEERITRVACNICLNVAFLLKKARQAATPVPESMIGSFHVFLFVVIWKFGFQYVLII